MNITLKQARALRDALKESSPELIAKWRAILGMEEVKEEDSNVEEKNPEE